MRISDWSSDVCSSDLGEGARYPLPLRNAEWRLSYPRWYLPADPGAGDMLSRQGALADHLGRRGPCVADHGKGRQERKAPIPHRGADRDVRQQQSRDWLPAARKTDTAEENRKKCRSDQAEIGRAHV